MSGSDYERELKSILEENFDYIVIRSAGSMGEGDLIAIPYDDLTKEITCNSFRNLPTVIEVKSTNKDTYYTTNNEKDKEQYEVMKYKEDKFYGINFIYCIRWKDYTHKDKKDKWEVFNPLDSHIMKKGEGKPLGEVF